MNSFVNERCDYLIAHLQSAVDLTEPEKAALNALANDNIAVLSKDKVLATEGDPHHGVYIVRSGWAIRHKDLPNGDRQVLDFVLPGDLVGIEGCVLPRADHSVTALTDLRLAHCSFERTEKLLRDHPRLIAALVWSVAGQRTIFAEHLVSLGRRSAYERIAHLIVEMYHRLHVRGLADNQTFSMPVTQGVLADMLGLSVVHVNRSLRRLAQDRLIEKHRDTVKINDLAALITMVPFNDRYLDHAPMPEGMGLALDRLNIHGDGT